MQPLTFKPESNEKLSENGVIATRTMNTLLHVFEAYTELYRVTGEQKVAEKLKEMLYCFCENVYHKERHRLEVFFDKDYKARIPTFVLYNVKKLKRQLSCLFLFAGFIVRRKGIYGKSLVVGIPTDMISRRHGSLTRAWMCCKTWRMMR